MRAALCIAWDVLLEALSRKWILALAIGVTVVLAGFAAFLKLDVVDGALAASHLFGDLLSDEILAVDVALGPVFAMISLILFWGGMLIGVLVTADFAPSLLAPGRVELLLALPVRRAAVVLGLWLGIMALSFAASLYGSLGVTLILVLKTGYFTALPLLAGLAGCVCFGAVYAAMLAAAAFARSAALSALVGGFVCAAGIVASQREVIAAAFEPGLGRGLFLVSSAVWPRLVDASMFAAGLASGEEATGLGQAILGHGLFAAAMLLVGLWHFEGRDL